MADFGVGVPDEIARLSLGQGSVEQESRTAPPVRSTGIIQEDITQKFFSSAKALKPGELVKDGFFTLFESVAALEIMDPKMDSGRVADGDVLEELYDVAQPLQPEQVLGIMDRLLCLEMSYHMGYPLSQTLFTSVYVEALSMPDPGNIQEAVFKNRQGVIPTDDILRILRAYCLATLKTCSYVNERIKSEHYYEEEDFVANTYKRTLLSRIPTRDIRDALTQASTLARASTDNNTAVMEAILDRIQLRQVFLDAVESPQHIQDIETVRQPWKDAIPILPQIKASHNLGKSVDEAFSVKLQRKLASTMPPRAIVHMEFDEAFSQLSRLFHDGLQLVDVLNYHDSQSLLTFIRTFQAEKPQPLIYTRTLLQTFLFDSMQVLGTMSIRQLLDDDLAIITLPASPLLDRDNDEIEATHDPRFAISQQMEHFRKRAAQPYLDVFRTMCQNRSRVRRTLTHLIRDWENLQFDGEDIDQILQIKTGEQPLLHRSSMTGGHGVESYALSLSSWAFLYKVRMMEEIVQFGFELEVYQADELSGMYWYLTSLAKIRLQHAERIKSFVARKAETYRRQPQTLDAETEKQLHRSLAHIRLTMLDAAVTWELADALSCIYTVLERLDLVKRPNRPYSTDELRYELRMKPFAPIGLPALPTFEEFTAGTKQPGASSEDLLAYADRAITGAKQGFETLSKLSAEDSFSVGSHDRWTASVKNCLKSCIAAGLAVTMIRKELGNVAAGKESTVKVEVPLPEKGYHEWWIVPKIIPK